MVQYLGTFGQQEPETGKGLEIMHQLSSMAMGYKQSMMQNALAQLKIQEEQMQVEMSKADLQMKKNQLALSPELIIHDRKIREQELAQALNKTAYTSEVVKGEKADVRGKEAQASMLELSLKDLPEVQKRQMERLDIMNQTAREQQFGERMQSMQQMFRTMTEMQTMPSKVSAMQSVAEGEKYKSEQERIGAQNENQKLAHSQQTQELRLEELQNQISNNNTLAEIKIQTAQIMKDKAMMQVEGDQVSLANEAGFNVLQFEPNDPRRVAGTFVLEDLAKAGNRVAGIIQRLFAEQPGLKTMGGAGGKPQTGKDKALEAKYQSEVDLNKQKLDTLKGDPQTVVRTKAAEILLTPTGDQAKDQQNSEDFQYLLRTNYLDFKTITDLQKPIMTTDAEGNQTLKPLLSEEQMQRAFRGFETVVARTREAQQFSSLGPKLAEYQDLELQLSQTDDLSQWFEDHKDQINSFPTWARMKLVENEQKTRKAKPGKPLLQPQQPQMETQEVQETPKEEGKRIDGDAMKDDLYNALPGLDSKKWNKLDQAVKGIKSTKIDKIKPDEPVSSADKLEIAEYFRTWVNEGSAKDFSPDEMEKIRVVLASYGIPFQPKQPERSKGLFR